jgi:hypothetical protein
MAIVRTQYITIAELNEILGVSTYTDDDLIKVYEASELLEYHLNDQVNEYDTSNAPDNLKIATAYQVQYGESGIDDEYTQDDSFSIGKYSNSTNGVDQSEFYKISPKSRRLIIDLTRRVL